VKIHIKEHAEHFERFGAQWTPTIQILDSGAIKRHQFEGFLPAVDFLGQLRLGLAHIAFAHQNWNEAERHFRTISEELPESDAAPEAIYWSGVAKYKRTGDASALGETAQQFRGRYSNSTWAKKASVWAA
jgi:hypothetical protein